MSYDKRTIRRGPDTFVAESEAMGVRFMLDNGQVLVSIAGAWLPSHDPLVVAANQPDVVNVLRERVTV